MTAQDRQAAGPSRRSAVIGLISAGGMAMTSTSAMAAPLVTTGAAAVAGSDFAMFAGKRVGLITNHTGLVHTDPARASTATSRHLVDLMVASRSVRLTAILAPEHGFRGKAEAGASVANARDPKTGIAIHSLYGATKSPTTDMLRDVDVLVFDIQDIGARFYTYISTLGLAMQSAARARIPFVVLDRPNPIGGIDVSGFVLDLKLRSFVGQYPIPIVHGMSVGELARMIKAERWLAGVESVDLQVVACKGWSRAQRWPATGQPWIATSPNIPTFASALVYPGIGVVGETRVNEGRGTPTPFEQFGAPWIDAPRLAADLDAARLPGVRCAPVRYTPRPIANVAADPRFADQDIAAVRLQVTDVATYRPLDVGMHALALLAGQARAAKAVLLPDKLGMFNAIAGTTKLAEMLRRGATGADIVGAWRGDVARFVERRRAHLLY